MTAAAALALAAALCGSARAEVVVQDVRWSLAAGKDGKRGPYVEASRWAQPPAARIAGRPRAVVTLANLGRGAEPGVLVRCAVSARLFRVGDAKAEGVWSVPFWTDEKRIPFLRGAQVKRVVVDDPTLGAYLQKMFRAGFWVDALRIQVMVDPRAGEGLERHIMERDLAVDARPPASAP